MFIISHMNPADTKPSPEAIKEYKEKIESFLKFQNVTIEITLRDYPRIITSTIRNPQGETKTEEHLWIDKVIVKSPKIKFELNNLPWGNTWVEHIDDKSAWIDAVYIQNLLYHKLEIPIPHPPAPGDIYWKLWDLQPGK